ncbi:MAG: T9SS type A sorting domain-containing protein, partial [Chitinophagaceae bacterium]
LKLGATKTNASQTARQFGIYMKGFVYPNFSTLPVSLEYFTAVPDTKMSNVFINWATSVEKNASHFVIEKSTDGRNYAPAGIVFATGNSSDLTRYSFTDNNIDASAKLIYYRLRSVDYDATSELSQVRTIRFGTEINKETRIATYPNPFTSELRVTVPAGWYGKAINFEIYNSNGQALVRKAVSSASQTETFPAAQFAPGVYILKATCHGEFAQQKLIKQ